MSEGLIRRWLASMGTSGGWVTGDERRTIAMLLAKVKALEAENVQLRGERRWTPVEERLPPTGEDVLTLSFFSDGSALVCIGWHNGREWMHYVGRGPGLPVSHWQPLPR